MYVRCSESSSLTKLLVSTNKSIAVSFSFILRSVIASSHCTTASPAIVVVGDLNGPCA